MHKLLLLLFVLTGFQAVSQIEEIRRITEQLCDPAFHGRGYVNKGDSIAADFLVDEFKKLGLESYKGDHLQHFEIDQVNTFPGKMTVKNLSSGDLLTPGVDYVVDPSSSGFEGKLIPSIVEGSDIFSEDKLRDAITQVLENRGGKNVLFIDYTALSEDSISKVRGIGQAFTDLMPVIEITKDKFTWSVGREQMAHLYLHVQKSAYSGEELQVEIEAELLSDYQSQNVMAYLPAKKKCKETIMFTAHYDHLGRMGEDTYFPGGNDNASGTAMLLTMAKYFKENPADYNILFVAFAGEEAGLLGSKYFVENTPVKLKKVRFLLNLDIMGSGEEGITAVNATLFPEEYDLLVSINEELGLLEKVKKRGPTQNSDHYWFTEKGVPAFFIYTMGPNKNYHDIFDTYENLSFKEYEDITKLLVTFVDRLD